MGVLTRSARRTAPFAAVSDGSGRAGGIGRTVGRGCAQLPAAAVVVVVVVVGQDLGDHIAGQRRQIQLGGRQVGVPEDPLDVGQRQLRIAGHPVGGGVPQVVQGPVGAQRVGGAGEHRPRGVVGQRPQRAPPGPPQWVVAPGRQRLVALAPVEPQPHQRVRGRRNLLQRARALADHGDQLPASVDVAATQAEQFRRARPGGHPQRDQCPVPMRAELGEQPVEQLVRDRARDPPGDPGPIQPHPLVAERLHRVVVRVRPPTAPLPRQRERVDHRAGARVAMDRIGRAARWFPGGNSFSARPSSEPRGPVSGHVALQ
jgi:hypothetical protein